MSIRNARLAAHADGSFVVFLIGMRINAWWRPDRYMPVMASMPRMLKELDAQPERGFLGADMWAGRTMLMVQYWRSFEALHAYAHDRAAAHLPAWAAFNRRVGTDGTVGIWHETYLVENGRSEAIYVNMPPIGLGKAFGTVPATGRRASATERLGRPANSEEHGTWDT